MADQIDTGDWARAIRSTPDRKAPSAPSRPVGIVTDLLVKLLLPPVVLLHVPILAFVKLWHRKRGPKWSFLRLVGVNMMRLNTVMLNPWFPRPRPTEEEWGIASEGKPIRDAISGGDLELETVKLDPVGPELRKDVADVKGVEGATVPGFWVRPKGTRTDKVNLYIHGGAYIRGHPFWTPFALGLAKDAGVQVFAVNYRKCLSEATAFPAPLLDALSAYTYLLESYDAADITFSGDSAGAHLCLFLSRYLPAIDLPQPGSMALISPWADFAPAYDSYTRNGWYDFLHLPRLLKAVKSATRWYADYMKSSVWFSPAKAAKGDFVYLREAGVKVHMSLGTRELFEDEIRLLYDVMLRDGVDVHLHEHPDGVHAEMVFDAKARAGLIDGVKKAMQGP